MANHFPFISIRGAAKRAFQDDDWYFNWVKEGFMDSALSYMRFDIRLHECI